MNPAESAKKKAAFKAMFLEMVADNYEEMEGLLREIMAQIIHDSILSRTPVAPARFVPQNQTPPSPSWVQVPQVQIPAGMPNLDLTYDEAAVDAFMAMSSNASPLQAGVNESAHAGASAMGNKQLLSGLDMDQIRKQAFKAIT